LLDGEGLFRRGVNPKLETRNSKQIQMTKIQRPKQYDLEDRTLMFAKRARVFVGMLPKTLANVEDSRQLIRSSGSVGANYIEANEALSRKDFIMRIKIGRKEAKESRYWLQLFNTSGKQEIEKDRKELINEATELMNIFGSILQKNK
jgi:four helix bundle protein